MGNVLYDGEYFTENDSKNIIIKYFIIYNIILKDYGFPKKENTLEGNNETL